MNKYKYKIKGIYHSGRKGKRWDPVTDEKYDGMIGQLCTFDPEKVEQLQTVMFYLKTHPLYRYWHTSEVIQFSYDFDGSFVLETANSIYVFEEATDGN